MPYWDFKPYVSVAEKRAKAEKKLIQLKKKNSNIKPVVIQGQTIAHTWWGKAWCTNLEAYADFSNRIGRGRSYVRHGAVLDLQIQTGLVQALVQGSESKPYTVAIRIAPLPETVVQAVRTACAGRIDSLQDLLAGRFPKALADQFREKGKGLFPAPGEIQLSCSCPDWAVMCKHVAAVLYGIGARLDEDPALLFTLRGVKTEDLIAQTLQETTGRMLDRAGKRKDRVIADADLGAVFGIEMEDQPGDAAQTKDPAHPPKAARPPVAAKPEKAAGRKADPKHSGPADDRSRILAVIQASATGVDAAHVQRETGLNIIKIRNVISQAHIKGEIERAGRGVYRGKAPHTPKDDMETIRARIEASEKGMGVPDIKQATGLPDARVRYILQRLFAAGRIRRLSYGVYGGVNPRGENRESSLSDTVLAIIQGARKGADVAMLLQKSSLTEQQIRNTLVRLIKLGKITRVSRGIYKATRKR